MVGVSMETVFTAVSDIISTGGGGGQRQILIGSDSDTVLSTHSGPTQHPPVLRVHVVQERLLGQAEVIHGGLVAGLKGALPASVADGLGLSWRLRQRRHGGQRGH